MGRHSSHTGHKFLKDEMVLCLYRYSSLCQDSGDFIITEPVRSRCAGSSIDNYLDNLVNAGNDVSMLRFDLVKGLK